MTKKNYSLPKVDSFDQVSRRMIEIEEQFRDINNKINPNASTGQRRVTNPATGQTTTQNITATGNTLGNIRLSINDLGELIAEAV